MSHPESETAPAPDDWIRERFHRLSIRVRPEHSPALLARYTDVLLDDLQIKGIRSLTLELSDRDFNTVTLRLTVRDIEVDEVFIAALDAHVKAKQESDEPDEEGTSQGMESLDPRETREEPPA